MSEPVEILLVEDYEPDAQLVSILLKRNRIANKVHLVRDGGEALDFLFCRGAYHRRSFEHPPGVVLLDIRLPKLDGWEVLHRLRQDPRTSRIPVVIMSGSIYAEDMEKGKQLGALGCLSKPVPFEKLRELLTESGFVWLLLGQQLQEN
ncbi:MAG TPA: response regulator [Verrucomicrobiae bacterium]|nr:response regulator [Verrucomicrobiae bacterium]